MSGKNLWPLGLTVFIIAFLSVTVIGVIYVSTVDFDLVDDDYYSKGIGYQQTIDMHSRTAKLDQKPAIDYRNNRLFISFPEAYRGRLSDAKLFFYRSSDKSLDRTYTVLPGSDMTQVFDIQDLKQGNWKLTLTWSLDGISYALDQTLYIK